MPTCSKNPGRTRNYSRTIQIKWCLPSPSIIKTQTPQLKKLPTTTSLNTELKKLLITFPSTDLFSQVENLSNVPLTTEMKELPATSPNTPYSQLKRLPTISPSTDLSK